MKKLKAIIVAAFVATFVLAGTANSTVKAQSLELKSEEKLIVEANNNNGGATPQYDPGVGG